MNAEALYQDLLKYLKEGLFQKASHQPTPVYLVGLAIGGAWLAERLAHDLSLTQYGVINVSFHRDDYAEKGIRAIETANTMPTKLPFDVTHAHIVFTNLRRFCQSYSSPTRITNPCTRTQSDKSV